ncbi:MAG: hypothetical protein ABFC34_15505 [Methanobacterium sp.]
MTEIKTYLKLGNKEINTLEDLTTFLNEPHDGFYDIEILEPVLGKFNRWNLFGKVTYCEPQQYLNEILMDIDVESGKIEDAMLNEINRESTVSVPIREYTENVNGINRVCLGRRFIPVEDSINWLEKYIPKWE